MIVYTVAIRNHKICTVLDDYHTANITKQEKYIIFTDSWMI